VSRTLTAAAVLVGVALLRIGRAAFGCAALWIEFGPAWAVVGALALLLLRFSVPIRIGVLIGAIELLHWPWIAALTLAAPRLFTVLPGLFATQLARWRHPRPLWPSPDGAQVPADGQV